MTHPELLNVKSKPPRRADVSHIHYRSAQPHQLELENGGTWLVLLHSHLTHLIEYKNQS